MSTLGKNLKITAPRSAQPQTRAMFDAFGATRLEPAPQLDVFKLDGTSIAFEYLAEADALTPAQMRIAPWIEIVVDDVGRTTRALAALGCERLDYHDQEHPYFAAAGGLVLRLAAPLA